MDETFDEWLQGKVAYGYHDYFDQWFEDDLLSMVRRDRNHPSIVLWSVGNEMPEQSRSRGSEHPRKLVDIVHARTPPGPSPRPATTSRRRRLPRSSSWICSMWWATTMSIAGASTASLMYRLDVTSFPARQMIGSENSSLGGHPRRLSPGGRPAGSALQLAHDQRRAVVEIHRAARLCGRAISCGRASTIWARRVGRIKNAGPAG